MVFGAIQCHIDKSWDENKSPRCRHKALYAELITRYCDDAIVRKQINDFLKAIFSFTITQ